MHASSMENMQRCHDRYVACSMLDNTGNITVLDVGGSDINGSYKTIFHHQNFSYLTADIDKNSGVDIVLDTPYKIPLDDGAVDIVLSGQMLEHCEFFWESFKEMARILNDTGMIFLIAPSAGPIHRYPVDCYRFYPDAYQALAKYAGCHLIETWLDERGPWRDLVGVFSKNPNVQASTVEERKSISSAKTALVDIDPAAAEKEILSGETSYIDILHALHNKLKPVLYLEIGVRKGHSLALAQCDTIAIDPDCDIDGEISENVSLFEMTSDNFFFEKASSVLSQKIDFSFIDGMHLFEFVLRDFMHVEKYSGTNTMVAIDDIYPNHPAQASRQRQTRVWTGDVWKIVICLKKYRPELKITCLNSSPTGLMLVTGLDSRNTVLQDHYNGIVREYSGDAYSVPPEAVLLRFGSLSPSDYFIDMGAAGE